MAQLRSPTPTNHQLHPRLVLRLRTAAGSCAVERAGSVGVNGRGWSRAYFPGV